MSEMNKCVELLNANFGNDDFDFVAHRDKFNELFHKMKVSDNDFGSIALDKVIKDYIFWNTQ